MSGIGIAQILSDDKHYRPFLCSICSNLVSLEAVVASRCSHPYCPSCLRKWAQEQQDQQFTSIPCPDCGTALAPASNVGCTTIAEGLTLAVQPLQQAQPLAYQCLLLVQVVCLGSANSQCDWTGNYGDYLKHAASKGCTPVSNGAKSPRNNHHHTGVPQFGVGALIGTPRSRRQYFQRALSMPSVYNHELESSKSKTTDTDEENSTEIKSKLSDTSLGYLGTPVGGRKSASLRELGNRGIVDAPPLLEDGRPAHSLSHSHHPPNHHHNNPYTRTPSQGKRASPRWASLSGTPVSVDSHATLELGPPRDTPPNMVRRRPNSPPTKPKSAISIGSHRSKQSSSQGSNNSKSLRNILPDQGQRNNNNHNNNNRPQSPGHPATTGSQSPRQQQQQLPTTLSQNSSSRKPVPEDKRLKKAPRRKSGRSMETTSSDEINDSQRFDSQRFGFIDASTGSLDLDETSNSTEEGHKNMEPMETLDEENTIADSVQKSVEVSVVDIEAIVAQAEKFKKQANAKFNKGDFATARTLYTDGIRAMNVIKKIGPKEGEILSNMHSNRGVTFFREKHFTDCIKDCEQALHYDPYYEKSWIRKWRAQSAMGHFKAALETLESGLISVPDPSKIKKELSRAKADMELVDKATSLLAKQGYEAARDLLKPHLKQSPEHIAILQLAARADASLGLMESGLEKANKALRVNPDHAEGLAVRGCILYMAGETEKGLHLLQDAHSRDKDNKAIRLDLRACLKTHTCLAKGRSCVKRGRYVEAVEQFTAAMKDERPLSVNTPLYAMMKCERAEAWMFFGRYKEALDDCQTVIDAQEQYAAAWSTRAEILIALGRASDAKKELMAIRRSWGAGNPTIQEGYRRVDFELRVIKADEELTSFVISLERSLGTVVPGAADGLHRSSSGRHLRGRPKRRESEKQRSSSSGKKSTPRRSSTGTSTSEGGGFFSRGPKRAVGQSRSTRRLSGGTGEQHPYATEESDPSKARKRPNGLDRKVMSERGLDVKTNRRQGNVKRT